MRCSKEHAETWNESEKYQNLLGRKVLLSESYLSQPIAEFLIHHHPGKVGLEFPHPVLNNPSPGRPKQVDFVLESPQRDAVVSVIESKWIAEYPYDKQAILNDLVMTYLICPMEAETIS